MGLSTIFGVKLAVSYRASSACPWTASWDL